MTTTPMTREEVLTHLTRAARFDPRSLFDAAGNLKPPQDWSDDTAAAIAGVEVQETRSTKRKDEHEETSETKRVLDIHSIDRLKVLELLGKVHGLFDLEDAAPEEQGSLAALLAQATQDNGGLNELLRR